MSETNDFGHGALALEDLPEQLRSFAQSAYFANPLPLPFKERLFKYLIQRPASLPTPLELKVSLERLQHHTSTPASGTQLEADLLHALAVVFFDPGQSETAREAARRYLGD